MINVFVFEILQIDRIDIGMLYKDYKVDLEIEF